MELAMKIAMLSPIAWRTPPRHYGPWENVVSLLTEGLVARRTGMKLIMAGIIQDQVYFDTKVIPYLEGECHTDKKIF